MNTISALTRRNIKLFFKDKGMFFSSMITPIILLVLYSTFLSKVYKDIFISIIPQSLNVSDKKSSTRLPNGQLVSSLLAVCCITVAFCSNLIMVQDKHLGTRKRILPFHRKELNAVSELLSCTTAANTLTGMPQRIRCMSYIHSGNRLGNGLYRCAADAGGYLFCL